VQHAGGVPDGVTFGHAAILPLSSKIRMCRYL
jgi:hypothetical protein